MAAYNHISISTVIYTVHTKDFPHVDVHPSQMLLVCPIVHEIETVVTYKDV